MENKTKEMKTEQLAEILGKSIIIAIGIVFAYNFYKAEWYNDFFKFAIPIIILAGFTMIALEKPEK